MLYANFDQTALIKFLAKQGFNLNRTTIFNYTRYGYITAPIKKPNATKGGRRICYHPFTCFEILTALLLFKGDFLIPDSEFRIPRFSGLDVFLARLNMYKLSNNLLSYQHIYLHCTDATEYFKDCYVGMDALYIESFLSSKQDDLLCELIKQQNEGKVKDSYLTFIVDIYSVTFKYLYGKYIDELMAFIDENEKFGGTH